MIRHPVFAMIGMLTISTISLKADVVLPNERIVPHCAKIQNLGNFPDIVLIGCETTMSGKNLPFVIKQDSCIYKGYVFDRFHVLWVFKSYFDSVGLTNLPLNEYVNGQKKTSSVSASAQSPLHYVNGELDNGREVVATTNPLVSADFIYNVVSNNSTISVYLAKKISYFSDNTSKTETFAQPAKVISNGFTAVRKIGVENLSIKNGIFTFSTTFNGKLDMTLVDCMGKMIARQSRVCAPGNTYVSDFAGMKSGVYWMRLKTPNVDMVKRLTFMR